jgi:hypothetical protein
MRYDLMASRPGFDVSHSCQVLARVVLLGGHLAGLTRMLL